MEGTNGERATHTPVREESEVRVAARTTTLLLLISPPEEKKRVDKDTLFVFSLDSLIVAAVCR